MRFPPVMPLCALAVRDDVQHYVEWHKAYAIPWRQTHPLPGGVGGGGGRVEGEDWRR